jgi:LysR family transcriptional regulator, regulator for genes of the gallate degradation pathway
MAKQKLIAVDDSTAQAINLRHLRVLAAVAHAGSVARAAEGLFRVSSAVTRSIGELEKSLSKPLFERHARGMVLTRFGEIVLVRAQRIEREFDEARVQLEARGGLGAKADPRSLFAAILNGRRLAVFTSLAEKRNMAVVARDFGITQPAISAALRDLEQGLSATLIERSARGLVPTAAGEIVAFYFKRVLSELRHIEADIAASEGRLQGSIRIGALPLGRTQIMPLAIAALLTRHPQLHAASFESPYEALVLSLRSGEIDFIFGALRPASIGRDLKQEALFVDRLSIIARAGHPLTRLDRIDFDTLRKATWVLSRRGSPSRELLEESFSTASETPPVPAVETGDLALLRGLLLESDMLTALSPHQLRYEIADGSLVVLGFPLERTRREIGITQREGAFPSPGATALMDEVRAVVRRSPHFSAVGS